MIIVVARSRTGFGVLVGSDLVEAFNQLDDARGYAAKLCDEAAACGETMSWVDVSEAATPPALPRKP